jgi:hypothetical protein
MYFRFICTIGSIECPILAEGERWKRDIEDTKTRFAMYSAIG